MQKQNKKSFYLSLLLLAAFILWTVAVSLIDIQTIGPNGSSIGFASLNSFIHRLTGVNLFLYEITDCLSLIPLSCAFGFALLGLWQWIRRKSLVKVDRSILLLGIFYIAVMAAYIFFEFYAVNYRPILLEDVLEPSYPSSTTMLVLTVMSTTIMQLNSRISNPALRKIAVLAIAAFSAFMLIGRLLSGAHWFTDIIGGILLSAALVMLYATFVE
ncbi:MAG: phosphatase PAP2 family protein [Firmicutes bacterium]|nr:phosphatase PAP2 family protein [Bacillota bacterium]